MNWFHFRRALADGRVVYVFPILFGRARLGISPTIEDQWFTDVW